MSDLDARLDRLKETISALEAKTAEGAAEGKVKELGGELTELLSQSQEAMEAFEVIVMAQIRAEEKNLNWLDAFKRWAPNDPGLASALEILLPFYEKLFGQLRKTE